MRPTFLRSISPSGAEDALAEALDDRALHLRVVAQEVVDDLVARDDRGTVARERAQRLALARADPAGDGDGDRAAARRGGRRPLGRGPGGSELAYLGSRAPRRQPSGSAAAPSCLGGGLVRGGLGLGLRAASASASASGSARLGLRLERRLVCRAGLESELLLGQPRARAPREPPRA